MKSIFAVLAFAIAMPAVAAEQAKDSCLSCCKEIVTALKEKCPEPKKVAKKRKPVQKKKAPPVAAPPAAQQQDVVAVQKPAATPGCVVNYFTTKPGDSFIRIPIHGTADSGIAKDPCTGIKRPGDADFGPWRNEVCPKVPTWVCDFSRNEKITGRKVVLMGSYRTTPGEHAVRLPAYFASEPYVTGFALIRGDVFPTLAEHPTFLQAEEYGVQRRNWMNTHSTGTIGVRQFDYSPSGVATIRYSQGDARVGEADLYFPTFGEYDATAGR